MKIVHFDLPESTIEAIAATEHGSEMLYAPAPGVSVHWRFVADFGMESEDLPDDSERAKAIRWLLEGFKAATGETFDVVDVTGFYVEGITTAPERYDGFGTITVRDNVGYRIVAILKAHETWQSLRYQSGLYPYKRANEK